MGNGPIASGRIAKAICQRCNQKRPYMELSSDPNYPGLRVCPPCKDLYDPYRLPPRQEDPIAMMFPRPDVPLTVEGNYVVTNDGAYINFFPPEGDWSP